MLLRLVCLFRGHVLASPLPVGQEVGLRVV